MVDAYLVCTINFSFLFYFICTKTKMPLELNNNNKKKNYYEARQKKIWMVKLMESLNYLFENEISIIPLIRGFDF